MKPRALSTAFATPFLMCLLTATGCDTYSARIMSFTLTSAGKSAGRSDSEVLEIVTKVVEKVSRQHGFQQERNLHDPSDTRTICRYIRHLDGYPSWTGLSVSYGDKERRVVTIDHVVGNAQEVSKLLDPAFSDILWEIEKELRLRPVRFTNKGDTIEISLDCRPTEGTRDAEQLHP